MKTESNFKNFRVCELFLSAYPYLMKGVFYD